MQSALDDEAQPWISACITTLRSEVCSTQVRLDAAVHGAEVDEVTEPVVPEVSAGGGAERVGGWEVELALGDGLVLRLRRR